MASRWLHMLTWTAALCVSAQLQAEEEEELPDMDFLEYLGMWEETDEDWLLLDEEVDENTEDSAADADESAAATEKTDEN